MDFPGTLSRKGCNHLKNLLELTYYGKSGKD